MKTLHNEKAKAISFLDEHYYLDPKTESYYPSVTTILDVYPKGYGFHKWLKDLGSNADIVLKEAAKQGSLIHDTIQRFFSGEEIRWADDSGNVFYTEEQWKMLMRFYDFYKTFRPELIAVEQSLVDAELGIGGTIDFVGKINNEVWLLDWKSSNGVYKSHELQASAYVELWNKIADTKISKYGILHLKAATRGPGKNGVIQGKGWKVHEPKESQEELYKLFSMTKAIWHKENPNAKPKNMIYPDRFSTEGGEKNA